MSKLRSSTEPDPFSSQAFGKDKRMVVASPYFSDMDRGPHLLPRTEGQGSSDCYKHVDTRRSHRVRAVFGLDFDIHLLAFGFSSAMNAFPALGVWPSTSVR